MIRKVKNLNRKLLTHTIEPVYNQNSRVLILGTFPSPKSRESNFYYGHPQNRFWPVIAYVCNRSVPQTKDDKIKLLLEQGIALWDVLHSCSIAGADDSSIRNPTVNDLTLIFKVASIKAIFTTGRKAEILYKKYCLPQTGKEAFALPSTSPANCRINIEELRQAYCSILPYLR